MSVKTTINLLQPELLPERQLLTLQNVAVGWVLALIVVVGASFYLTWEEQSLASEKKQLTAEKRQLAQTMESLQAQLAKHKVSSNLLAKREQLKIIVTNKNALLAQLTNKDKTEVTGFAQAMTELANFHSRDISLQSATFNTSQISFTGIAKTPDAVPQWLSGFENSVLLSGQHFNHFQLVENDENYTEFSVSSDMSDGTAPLGDK